MNFCCCLTFAAVYLQSVGYSNTELGIVVALGNVLGAVISPVMTSLVSSGKIRNLAATCFSLAIQLASYAALIVLDEKCLAFSAAYVLLIAFCYPANSLDMDFYTECVNCGIHIDFGIARAIGSLAFVFVSVLIGPGVEHFSQRVIAFVGIFIIALQFAAHLYFSAAFRKKRAASVSGTDKEGSASASESAEKPLTLFQFFARYKLFLLLVIGIIIMLSGFRISTSYLVNIVRYAGGDLKYFSYMTSYGAIIEIPFMILCSRILRRVRASVILNISFICYVIKLVLYALSSSIPVLILAITFQGPSYALYSSAVVSYVADVMPPKDAPVAQSLIFTCLTVSYVFASVVGGVLMDHFTVPIVMIICAVICIAGILIASPTVFALEKKGRSIS